MGERITYATCMLINELEFYHVCLEKPNRECFKELIVYQRFHNNSQKIFWILFLSKVRSVSVNTRTFRS